MHPLYVGIIEQAGEGHCFPTKEAWGFVHQKSKAEQKTRGSGLVLPLAVGHSTAGPWEGGWGSSRWDQGLLPDKWGETLGRVWSVCIQFTKEWASLIFKQKIFSSIYRTSQQLVSSVPLILQPNVVFLDICVSKQAIGSIEKGSFMSMPYMYGFHLHGFKGRHISVSAGTRWMLVLLRFRSRA